MLHGLLDLSFWGYVGVTLALTHVTIASVTIFLHRHQAHRALDLHPAVSHFFRFWLWLTTGMVTREWVAIHRKHHAKCETPDDPHSPQVLGLRKVLWQGAELYKREAACEQTIGRFSHGTPDDWLERNVYRRYNAVGLGLMLVLDLLLFGAGGLTIWAVQMMWIPFWAAGVINGVGHYFGYRNYECPDASTNIVPWGILIGGEELHNNHHAYSSSAKLSSRRWELDVGWLYIRLLDAVGLARVKKVAAPAVSVPGKSAVDEETLMAVIANRFQVTTQYGRQVMLPVLREEIRRADNSCRRLFKRAGGLLTRHSALVDDSGRRHLQDILARSRDLSTVYQFRQKLQEIWQRSTATPEMLVQALQEWCRQAEQTGIKALQEFACALPGYVRRPA